jgi:hypothetical protein
VLSGVGESGRHLDISLSILLYVYARF